MSEFLQFVAGGIKNIQRGTILINVGGVNTATATITSVDTAKSKLRFLGYSAAVDNLVGCSIRITLTNSTTITATRNGTGTADSCTVSWELTELY